MVRRNVSVTCVYSPLADYPVSALLNKRVVTLRARSRRRFGEGAVGGHFAALFSGSRSLGWQLLPCCDPLARRQV